jgi:arsenite methyltransferase
MIGAYVLRKFARPEGPFGALFARVMNVGNAALNADVIAKLQPEPRQAVLDVGFGGGVGLELAVADERIAHVAGIDPSADMVRAAKAKYRELPAGKSVDIRVGVAERLPWAEGVFDAAISVNSLYYWPDMAQAFAELKRVLRRRGTLLFGLRTKQQIDRLGLERYGYRSPSTDEISDLLAAAGFGSVVVEEGAASRAGGKVIIAATAP